MALFGLLFLVVALVLIGIGIAVGLVACGLAAVLLGLGIISSSLIIGIRAGRPAAGIRALLIQCGILIGIPAGAVTAWLTQAFLTAYGSGSVALVYGSLGGAIAGVVVALLFDFLSRRIHIWATTRFLPPKSDASPAIRVTD